MRRLNYSSEEKTQLFISKLEPVTDWTRLAKGELIFHTDTIDMSMSDTFESVDLIKQVMQYTNNGVNYTRSLSGWYLYDYGVAHDVEEYTTPKLYKYKDHILVANNEDELFNKVVEIVDPDGEAAFHELKSTYLEYTRKINYVDGYEIALI